MLTSALMVLVAGTLLTADAPKDDAVKKDLQQLQGEWALQASERNGEKRPEAQLKTFKRTITDNKYTVTWEDEEGSREFTGVMTLDPTQKPKTVDVEVPDGPNKGQKMLGIYKIEGDKHTVCVAAPDGPRPTDFDSKQGSLHVWKRVKK
jgi:uncharacterized protein (TIGR03067 family)